MAVMRLTAVGLLLMIQLHHVVAYPGGAPDSACGDMTPQHGYTAQSKSTFPFTIKPSTPEYCPKNEVNITLEGESVTFKGFLCQARTSLNPDATSGSLTSVDPTKTKNNCIGKAALTHVDGFVKKAVHLIWTPNMMKTDSIKFTCTVVQEVSRYWIMQEIEIKYAGADRCTSDGDVKGLPASCTDSSTCDKAFGMSICDNGKCVCPSDMKIAHPANTYCSPKVLGDACSTKDDCSAISMSVCNVTCMCPQQYKQQKNQTHTTCVLRALNDDCMDDEQCKGTANAKCIAGKCKLEDTCTTDRDCTRENGQQCRDGKCTSGATKAAFSSFILMFGSFLVCHLISMF